MNGEDSYGFAMTVSHARFGGFLLHRSARKSASDLEDVAFAGYDFIKNWVDEEAEDQARD
jgi:hypothetical protein